MVKQIISAVSGSCRRITRKSLATFISAAPAKKVKEQPVASPSSGKLVRVNTATCDQETNPKVVLAQHYLPLY